MTNHAHPRSSALPSAPVEPLLLPLDALAEALLDLCAEAPASPVGDGTQRRQVRPPLRPVARHGDLDRFEWESGGRSWVVDVPTDEGQSTEDRRANGSAAAAIRSACTRPRSNPEVAVLLSRLLELDGDEGQCRLERVSEVLYHASGGRDGDPHREHREREHPALKDWLAFFSRGLFHIDGGPPRPLLRVERKNRSSATVHLDPAVAKGFRSAAVPVPAEVLRLPRERHCNPHGHLPSQAVRARVRIAAIRAYRRGPAPKLGDVLRLAGVDLGPVRRRRRLGFWYAALTAELVAVGTILGGVGLAAAPASARRYLTTELPLVASVALRRYFGRPPSPPPRV